jgi:hypothetical protein
VTERTLSPLFTWRFAVVDWCEARPDSGVETKKLKHLALTLSLHMNERGGSCFPSIDTLAEETSMSRPTVFLAIAELEATGWLTVKRGGGRGRPNRYTATCPVCDENGHPPERVKPLDRLAAETVKSAPLNGKADLTVGRKALEDVLLSEDQELSPSAQKPRVGSGVPPGDADQHEALQELLAEIDPFDEPPWPLRVWAEFFLPDVPAATIREVTQLLPAWRDAEKIDGPEGRYVWGVLQSVANGTTGLGYGTSG